jgi:tetratricopeptide (TPR) repeat protein
MSMTMKALLAAALLGASWQAAAQPARTPECVRANDDVTRYRLGHDRNGAANAVDPLRAVRIGAAAYARCQGDGFFLLAFSMAKIDAAKDVQRTPLSQRTGLFNEGVGGLELLRRRVLAGQSDRYEVFNTLGLVYYDLQQYDKSVAILSEGRKFAGKMSRASQQNTYFTLGMAQLKLGRRAEASAAFGAASQAGHPQAAQWQKQVQVPLQMRVKG